MSRAFVTALAGHVGANCSFGQMFDYGIDCTIENVRSYKGRLVNTGFPIAVQLKASTNWKVKGGKIVYALEAKTWNDMVIRPSSAVPLYLALLCLPEDAAEWLICSEDCVKLQRCCYYFKAQGNVTQNVSSITIEIPRGQILNPENLQHLLIDAEQSERRS